MRQDTGDADVLSLKAARKAGRTPRRAAPTQGSTEYESTTETLGDGGVVTGGGITESTLREQRFHAELDRDRRNVG